MRNLKHCVYCAQYWLVIHCSMINNNTYHFVLHICLIICNSKACYWTPSEEKKQGKGGTRVTCPVGVKPPYSHQLCCPPGRSASWGVEKATSAPGGMSSPSTTQAAPSCVDFGNVFNVASTILKPFTEQIDSSHCSQASFNSELNFYLLPWTCRLSFVIRKEAPPEVSSMV